VLVSTAMATFLFTFYHVSRPGNRVEGSAVAGFHDAIAKSLNHRGHGVSRGLLSLEKLAHSTLADTILATSLPMV
jgi:hypothetical protein